MKPVPIVLRFFLRGFRDIIRDTNHYSLMYWTHACGFGTGSRELHRAVSTWPGRKQPSEGGPAADGIDPSSTSSGDAARSCHFNRAPPSARGGRMT